MTGGVFAGVAAATGPAAGLVLLAEGGASVLAAEVGVAGVLAGKEMHDAIASA
jgi:hypothetical protein